MSIILRLMSPLILLLAFTFTSYAAELHLYAGAGLKEPVEEIVKNFESQSGHKVVIEYGGSGQILTRFAMTQTGDLFLPGSADYVDKLKAQDQVLSFAPIALHTPVLVVRNDSGKGITTIEQLAKSSLKLGMGDPKAIALGVSGEKLLQASGFGPELKQKITVQTTTIKQLLLYLLNGDVDAAVIGRSDAIKHRDQLILLPTPKGTPEEVITIAVLKTSQQPILAQQLSDSFTSAKGMAIFARHGFLPIDNK